MFTVKSLRNLLISGFQGQNRGVAGIASSFPAPTVRHEPLPASPAFFTARPEYHSLLVQLELFHERFRNLPKSSGETLLFRGMISRTVLSNLLGLNVPLTVSEHRKVSQRVLALARLPAYTAEAELRDFLAAFEKPLKVRKVISQAEAVDEWGRAYAYGWRKSASCRAWIVPAKETGQVLVNGKPLSEYFVKMEDAEQVVYPLSLTDMVGRYNVWCLVRGGGTTGRLTWGVLTEECQRTTGSSQTRHCPSLGAVSAGITSLSQEERPTLARLANGRKKEAGTSQGEEEIHMVQIVG